MDDDTILVISAQRRSLANGFYAEYWSGYWLIYREGDSRQCVWTTVDLKEAREFSELPELQQYATEQGIRSAIEADSLVLYLETSWSSPFGRQSGITTVRVKNKAELKAQLRL